MKTRLLITAIALSMFGVAQAADETKVYPQVNVAHSAAKGSQSAYSMECTPPNSAEECAQFHKEIRQNFSNREIGMLFGASTAYAESRSAAPWVAQRYDNFARTYDEAHLTAFASTK
ncbi:MAG: hypothetical protein E6K53_06580 [Gammaproteobacteria bacterium]|nr:MAG: hypothetical protein E6K53_06580 [Gammaproteobacteria bacterium]